MRPRVFLPVLSSRFNLEAARPFGEVVYLLKTDDRSPFQTDALIHEFLDRLRADHFDPVSDFIAITGPQIFTALLLTAVVETYRKVRALIFHAASSRYVERVLDPKTWGSDS